MFKGLRTKIESEQKGLGSCGISSTKSEVKSSVDELTFKVIKSNIEPASEDIVPNCNNDTDLPSLNSLQPQENDTLYRTNNDELQENAKLRNEISNLNDRLLTVMKEKDESNEQNVQLYQLIEKLRRNLEREKEQNSSLNAKLNAAEAIYNEKEELLNHLQSKPKSSLVARSLNPNLYDESLLSESTEDEQALRRRILDLQNLLSEKNRQLKIKQQNLNDIKKALQKELLDHSKTQEELSRVQNQLKLGVQDPKERIENHTNENGSLDNNNANMKADSISYHSDRCQEIGQSPDGIVDATTTPQLDTMSCLSRSSTSVDEFESNDLHHNSSKEVNYEYLRNVLFRYMTSTDTETSRHLVKAITVLMNFNAEQSAAIKNAIDTRSSWLRLK